MRRLTIATLGFVALGVSACTTAEPTCRVVTPAEHAFFARIVAHDSEGVAGMIAPQGASSAAALRANNPALAQQVFGQRMGDRSVRTVLMRPPVCVYDAAAVEGAQLRYVFAKDRFTALQNPELPGVELGTPGADYAACRFVETASGWQPGDACEATFGGVLSSS